jgi:5-hydroxyisourate hydrolase-like protein (transthyretin family)
MIKRLLLLLLLLWPATGQAVLESQDFILEQPTFNYGSAATSSSSHDLFGTVGSGGLSDSADAQSESGATQQNVLPTPAAPILQIKGDNSLRISVAIDSSIAYADVQVEVRRESGDTPVYYDINGQISDIYNSWGPAASWGEGVLITELKIGETYVVRARARAETESVSEWSGVSQIKLGSTLVGGGILPPELTEPIKIWLETPVGQVAATLAEKLLVPIAAALIVAQAVAAASLLGQLLLDLILKLLASLSPLSQFWVFFKRRRPYGRVIDGSTKRPVVGAHVTLLRPDTKTVLDTQITDQDGRYLFTLTERQSYLLRVEAPQFDTFERLYRGEAVNREITLGMSLEFNAHLLRRHQRFDRTLAILNAWRLPLLLMGTGMWLLLYIRDGGFVLWLGIYYALAWLLEVAIRTQPSPYGIITDQATNQPLSGAVVRVFNQDEKLVLTFVTSSNGRFATLLRSGRYEIRVSHSGYQTSVLPRVLFTRRGTLQAIRFALKPLA